MPPQLSDDDSDVEVPDAIPAKKSTVAEAMDDDDDEEEGEDEYQVEKILKHKFVKGTTLYLIKWLGWDDAGDLTWEPRENLETAPEIIQAYHDKIGGTPEPPTKSSGKKAAGTKRKSEPLDSPIPKKNGRKANGSEWEPPVGSWEEHITRVAAILEEEEPGVIKKGKKDPKSLFGLIEWNKAHGENRKTQHQMDILRMKCPQRLLDYYEAHLLEPKLEEMADRDVA